MTILDSAGWILLHSLWQGGVVFCVTAGLLAAARRSSPLARYRIACAGLLILTLAPAATMFMLSPERTTERSTPILPTSGAVSGIAPLNKPATGALSDNAGGAARGVRFVRTLGWVWVAGVLAMSIRTAGGWWRIHRLHRSALVGVVSGWQAAGDRIAAAVGVRRACRFVETTRVDTPSVVGWLRPVVLLPIGALAGLSVAQVEAILAHELAHIRRHDYIVNVLQAWAETLLFYHPVIWWLSARIRLEREHCCDDVAIEVCGERVAYAGALVALEGWRSAGARFAPAATGGSILLRVRRILQLPAPARPRPHAAVAVLLAMLAVTAAAIDAQRPAPAQPTVPGPWAILSTPHFEIFHRSGDAIAADRIGAAAESAYAQLAVSLRHEIADPIAIVAASGTDLASAMDALPPTDRAAGRAVALSANRMTVPLDRDGPPIAHEVTHLFFFDIVPSSATVPSWLPEGLAEHASGVWTTDGLAVMNQMVAAGNTPALSQSRTSAFAPVDDTTRHTGHAAVDFIVQEFGRASVRRLLMGLRNGQSGDEVYRTAFGISAAQFDAEFARYVRARFLG